MAEIHIVKIQGASLIQLGPLCAANYNEHIYVPDYYPYGKNRWVTADVQPKADAPFRMISINNMSLTMWLTSKEFLAYLPELYGNDIELYFSQKPISESVQPDYLNKRIVEAVLLQCGTTLAYHHSQDTDTTTLWSPDITRIKEITEGLVSAKHLTISDIEAKTIPVINRKANKRRLAP